MAKKNRDAQIVKELKAGVTSDDLASKYDITRARIRQIGREGDFLHKETTAARKQKIIAEFQHGVDEFELAKKHKLRYETVTMILYANLKGYASHNLRTTAERNKVICEKFKEGRTEKQLATFFKLSLSSIKLILEKGGVLKRVKRDDVSRSDREKGITDALKKETALQEISSVYLVGPESIRKVAVKSGLSAQFLNLKRQRNVDLASEYKSRTSIKDLSKKYWVSEGTVKTTIRK